MSHRERYQKWEEVTRKYKIDNSRIATFELTVQNTLKLLKNKKEGLALDVGCGNGLIDIILAKRTNFQIIGIDISDTALENAKRNIREAGLEERIKIEKGDAYNLSYPDNHFDVIFSFGYASAVTYPEPQKEAYRVLRPGGLLICDFVNHHSFYKLIFLPKNIILGYAKIKEFSKIKENFKKTGFQFLSKIHFNTYPPILRAIIPVRLYILFEKIAGGLFRKILGRVILVCFQK